LVAEQQTLTGLLLTLWLVLSVASQTLLVERQTLTELLLTP
jgi:hypothetical protein